MSEDTPFPSEVISNFAIPLCNFNHHDTLVERSPLKIYLPLRDDNDDGSQFSGVIYCWNDENFDVCDEAIEYHHQ